MSQKYEAPAGPPPGYPQQPAQAYDSRGAGGYASPPPPEGMYGQSEGDRGMFGNSAPYGQPQQPMYYQQYPPPAQGGGYYNTPYNGPMPPGGGYYGGPPPGGRSGAGGDICAGVMAALACCCCLDFMF